MVRQPSLPLPASLATLSSLQGRSVTPRPIDVGHESASLLPGMLLIAFRAHWIILNNSPLSRSLITALKITLSFKATFTGSQE